MNTWKMLISGLMVLTACSTSLPDGVEDKASPVMPENQALTEENSTIQTEAKKPDLAFLPPHPSVVPETSAPSPTVLPACLPQTGLVNAPQSVAVELWPWGAKAAVSFTLDEGVLEPYTILLPEFDVRGWKASFFIYTDQPFGEKAWSEIRQAHLRGHEVSNHTKTHPDLTTLSDAQIHDEMRLGIEELKRQLGDENMTFPSFAYPYEATDERTWAIVKQYHRYARSGDHGALVPPNPVPINDAHNPDWGALTAKAITRTYSLDDWNSWIDATVEAGGWFIEELHGIEHLNQAGGWEPRTLEEFQAHFDYIETYGEQIWVAPMGEVAAFIEERESADITLLTWNTEGIEFTLKDAFTDENAYGVPLTLKLPLPEGWLVNKMHAQQAGQRLDIQAAEAGYFRIAAYPTGEKICILPQP